MRRGAQRAGAEGGGAERIAAFESEEAGVWGCSATVFRWRGTQERGVS